MAMNGLKRTTMRNLFTLQLTLLLPLLWITSVAVNADGWQMEVSKENYQLFKRKISSSEFLQVKGELVIERPFEHVLKSFGDGDKCWTWQKRCKKTKVVKVLSEYDQVVYVAVDMPWPLSDRDFLIRSHSQFDTQPKFFQLTLSPEMETQYQSTYVRGELNNKYMVTALTAQTTKITIIMHTEFGGTVSPSMINGRIIDELETDIKLLIKHAKK